MTVLKDKYYDKNLGNTQESVNTFLENHGNDLDCKLKLLTKIIAYLKDAKFFSSDKKTFNTNYFPYKVIISRLLYKFNNISKFNRHINNIINQLKARVLEMADATFLPCQIHLRIKYV